MKFNFNSEFSSDKGVLVFICDKNEPMHRYLTNLDKKNTDYNFIHTVSLWMSNSSRHNK